VAGQGEGGGPEYGGKRTRRPCWHTGPGAVSDELLSAEDTSSFHPSRFPDLRIGIGRAFSS